MIAESVSLQCVCFGAGFRLLAASDLLLAKMLEHAPWGSSGNREQGPGNRDQAAALGSGKEFALQVQPGCGYRLIVDDETVVESAELQSVLEILTRDLMVYVADHAVDRVFVHAGVVGWQGQAVIFPGASFAGKTTLVAELVRAGATYYSDEYAVIDEFGHVYPYPRNLQMREPGGAAQRDVPVGHLNGSAGVAPLGVSRVIFTEYLEGACWAPEPVSPGMAVLEMLRHAISVQRTPARVMAALSTMMLGATALRSKRGEAPGTAKALLSAMEMDV